MRILSRVAAVLILVCCSGLPPAEAAEVRLRAMSVIYVDEMGAGMSGPRSLDFDGASRLAVADSGNGRLLVYTVEEERIVPAAQITIPQAPYPVRVRFDPSGGLVILDGRSHRIVRTDADGTYRGTVDLPAEERVDPLPRSLDVDADGRIHVLEPTSGRVLVLDADGTMSREIAYPAEARSVADVAVGRNGTVFVVDSLARRVFVAHPGDTALSPLGEALRDDMTFPTGIALDEAGSLFLADDHGGGIVILGQDGSFQGRESGLGWKEGLLRYPSGLCAHGDRLFVADRGNNRVQIFRILR